MRQSVGTLGESLLRSSMKQSTTSSVDSLRWGCRPRPLPDSLVHASRLVAIGEMAAGIAHDINNPLAVVMMSLQMSGRKLKKNGEPTPEAIRRWPCGASITGPARTL